MMADTGIGRILPTEVIYPIQSYDRGTGSLHEDVGALRRERTLRVGQGVRKKGLGKQESAQPEMIVVVEQWICLVLGLVCWGEPLRWHRFCEHRWRFLANCNRQSSSWPDHSIQARLSLPIGAWRENHPR